MGMNFWIRLGSDLILMTRERCLAHANQGICIVTGEENFFAGLLDGPAVKETIALAA